MVGLGPGLQTTKWNILVVIIVLERGAEWRGAGQRDKQKMRGRKIKVDRRDGDPLFKRYRLSNGHGNLYITCKNHSVSNTCCKNKTFFISDVICYFLRYFNFYIFHLFA